MRIGIIGAGFIARAVATVAMKAGHEVMVSNSRDTTTLFTFTVSTGCLAGSPTEAAKFGDIVLVAIPMKANEAIPAAPLEGKIVLDANNYYPARDGNLPELDSGDLTTSEFLARHLPTSKVVKCFNAIVSGDIEKDGLPAGTLNRRALPIAGDDAPAKARVTSLLDELGFDTVDVGPLTEGWRFQMDTPAYCVRLDRPLLEAALANATPAAG
jgi:predicted dinucleotide-binding enzyme